MNKSGNPAGHRLAAVVDVSFTSGGHMLDWAATLREALRLLEQLLLSAKADVYAGLSHQRWRVLRGELPPRLRAGAVTAPLSIQIGAIRAAMFATDKFKTMVQGAFIEPAKAAGGSTAGHR